MKRIFALLLALLIPAAAFAGTPKEYVGPFRFEMEVETVQFGRYDQDNDPETEPEPIEWMVLEERDGKRLLFSRDLLEQKRFNETYGNNNWEGCTLRAWLNNEFMQTAFTEEERAAILLTHVDNSKEQDNPAYQDTNSGNDTDDYIFLISRYAHPAVGADGSRDRQRGHRGHGLQDQRPRLRFLVAPVHRSPSLARVHGLCTGNDAVYVFHQGFRRRPSHDVGGHQQAPEGRIKQTEHKRRMSSHPPFFCRIMKGITVSFRSGAGRNGPERRRCRCR